MSQYCGACIGNRVYLDVVHACPICGGALQRSYNGLVEPERQTTEIDVQVHGHGPQPVLRPISDLLPWLAGALVILVLAAVLVR